MTAYSKIRHVLRRCTPPILLDALRSRADTGHSVEYTLPAISLENLVARQETLIISFPVSQISRTRSMVLPLGDLLSISAICLAREPRRIFEIGTFTGSSTLLMAMNTPPTTEIHTLDLKPEDIPPQWTPYTAGSLFRETSYSAKIVQHFGHSSTFDFSQFKGMIDLVYIDADHSTDAVISDSQHALEMLSPEGLIIWDDYRWLPQHSECIGVTLALHRLAENLDIRQLNNTRLAVFENK